MKKTYMKPTMEVVKIATKQQMLIGSDFGDGTKPGGSAAGRRFRKYDWDEDWDDEEEF